MASSQTSPTAAGPALLSLKQAEREYGISSDTLRRAWIAKELALVRPGRGKGQGSKLFVRRTTLEAWLDQLEQQGGAQ